VIRKLNTGANPNQPNSFSYRLIDRFYINKHVAVSNLGFQDIASTFASGTALFNRLAADRVKSTKQPRALVFILRGHWYGHNLHNYLVGCALRQLGYQVSFVICTGSVERCGTNNVNTPLFAPPFTCNGCRKITKTMSLKGFSIINLNDYRSLDEDGQVEDISKLSRDEIFNYRLNGIPVMESTSPFLMRFYCGDRRRIVSGEDEALNHFKSAIRFLLRYNNLLDQVEPSCLCFFNGLFFPEYLFFKEARSRGIPSLFVERGMRKSTIFISLNEPACHYRSDRVWEQVRDHITSGMVEIAAAYLEKRTRTGPEDPTGQKRDLFDDDRDKYALLAKKPYVVLFAPVTHDTASMEKDDLTGDFFGTLCLLSSLAVKLKKRLVVRSHPDELGASNPSHYTVKQYMIDQNLLHGEYVLCLDSDEKWDPYTLARWADAIVVYNGTLGIELPALGYEIFNVAASNYSNKGFTHDIRSLEDFKRIFNEKKTQLSPQKRELALKYLYYYVHVANISVDCLLDEYKPFDFTPVDYVEETKQRAQLDSIKQRLALLLDLPS
jgi:hypothetical protein